MIKKKIAFVISSLNAGGAERVVSTLSNELIKTCDVCIITFISGESFYKLHQAVKVLHCATDIKQSENIFQALKNNYVLYRKISSFLKAEKIDITIGFMTTPNVLAILSAKANKIPVIISERINPKKAETSFFWRQLRKLSYGKANFLVVQTEEIKEYYTPKIAESKLVILRNPLSPELNNQSGHSNKRQNIVLNVGRLSDQKGHDVLIRAFSNLNPPNWKLIIVGEGKNRPIYEKLINDRMMTDKILLVGQKKDIAEYYGSAKIFAFPSRFEGFPNALIEAMHMGLACIATDCPTGPSELIQDGENGFLIDVDDQEALTKMLRTLMVDKNLMETFSRQGKIKVSDYKSENVAQKWKELIFSALEIDKFSTKN